MGLISERGNRVIWDHEDRLEAFATTGSGDRFDAILERTVRGEDATAACTTVGRMMAREGADLGEALDELRTTVGRAAGRPPTFAEMRALSVAWAEESLSYVHQLSCEDPLTGMAAPAHLRARLNEVYRDAAVAGTDASRTHGLVVLAVPAPPDDDPFGHALWWLRIGEAVRHHFPGEETISSAGSRQLVVLTRRDAELGLRLARLRTDLRRVAPIIGGRLWIEGLPPDVDAAGRVLDELLRRGSGPAADVGPSR